MNPNFYSHLLNMFVYGLSGIALMFLGFKLLDWCTPWMHFKTEIVEKQNIAVGIVVAALILGVSAIVSAIILAP